MNSDFELLDFSLDQEDKGSRLDRAICRHQPQHARNQILHALKNGRVQVNQCTITKPSFKVQGGERIHMRYRIQHHDEWVAFDGPIDIIATEADFIVVNKTAGCVTHPAPGHRLDTLMTRLLFHYPELSCVPRFGMIHRLDKDTTGLLVIARTESAHHYLSQRMAQRQIQRSYLALLDRPMIAGCTIDAPLGRHPLQRTKIAVRPDGRAARTHIRLIERFRLHSEVRVKLETGRTHQIRVHMAHIGHPVTGDPVYGGRLLLPPRAGIALREQLQSFRRQALHAAQLCFEHPSQPGKDCCFEVSPPEDYQNLRTALQQDCQQHDPACSF